MRRTLPPLPCGFNFPDLQANKQVIERLEGTIDEARIAIEKTTTYQIEKGEFADPTSWQPRLKLLKSPLPDETVPTKEATPFEGPCPKREGEKCFLR